MTAPSISVFDYCGVADTEVYAHDIIERIEVLKTMIREAQQEGAEVDELASAEYDQLIDFRERAQNATGKPFEQVTIVPDDVFHDFIREQTEENYDLPPGLAFRVDWAGYAKTVQNEYGVLDFGDDQVLVR